jgi:chromosome segregation ATPase
MNTFVAVCTLVVVGAAGFILFTFGGTAEPLLNAFWSLPLPQQAAWVALAIALVVMFPCAIWLSDRLVKQRKATRELEQRLGGVRQDVNARDKSQAEAESKVNQLVRSDPEDRIAGLQQRITEADRFVQVQQSRSEVGDLQARVDAIRSQQEALKERLDATLDKRRNVEGLFAELDRNQSDIERAIADIEASDDATDIDIHVRKLADFIKATHSRFDAIEHAAVTLTQQKDDIGALQKRLVPLEGEQDGVRGLIKTLDDLAGTLSSDLDGLEQSREGNLHQRVTGFLERKEKLGQRVANLDEQLSQLAVVRKDINGLLVNVGRALNSLSRVEGDESGANIGARTDEVAGFITASQTRFDEIEQAMVVLGQLKARLDGLQTRLVPLAAEEGGVTHLLDEMRDIRDHLSRKITRLEHDDECALAERVKIFSESKTELEDRVTVLHEQFSKLATIRRDIGGLLAKLSGTITSSMS